MGKEILPHDTLFDKIGEILRSSRSSEAKVYFILHNLASIRQIDIQRSVLLRLGYEVLGGPFSGMVLLRDAYWNSKVAQILGCYELELHPVIDEILSYSYDVILNIGCATGYYAVGFLRCFPSIEVWAYDIDDVLRHACREIGLLNGVSDRLHIGSECTHEMLQDFLGKRVLLFCDIEGSESSLLDPSVCSALRGMDILVELHDGIEGTGEKMRSLLEGRFSVSHDIRFILNGVYSSPLKMPLLPNELDRFLSVWSVRRELTPWLFMRCRSSIGD